MTIWELLIVWFLVSLIAAPLIGAFIRAGGSGR